MAEFNGKKIFEATPADFRDEKASYLESIEKFKLKKQAEAKACRDAYLTPEKLFANREEYVRAYEEMILLHKEEESGVPNYKKEHIGSDDFGEIYKLAIEVMPEFWFHGILTIPHGVTRAPLVIAQHGGGGTPELCNDFIGENNYTCFTKYILERKMIVFSPQLLLWRFKMVTGETFPPYPGLEFERDKIDGALEKVGESITGLEVFCLKRCIDLLETMDFVDEDRIGMLGLSYGGFYSMYTAAVEPRIKVVYSAGVFNDRSSFAMRSWSWRNSSHQFHDAEVCALIAPRPLFVDIGQEDPVFDTSNSVEEAARVKKYYTYLGKEENFTYNYWKGGHRFDIAGGNIHRFLDAVEQAAQN